MKRRIQNTLLMLGITPNLLGFTYICREVELIIEDSSYLTNIVRGLYGKIADEYDSDELRVERAIRHAISKIDKELWKSYGNAKFKNSEFLSTLALKITQEEEDNEQN